MPSYLANSPFGHWSCQASFIHSLNPTWPVIMASSITMNDWKHPVPVRASSKGCTIRRVEIPSNKLLTTAFEASLESVTVTCRLSVDSKIAGIAMEHRNPKVSEGRHRGQGGRQYMHLSLWWDFACLCGVVETIHVRQGLYVNWRGPAFSFQSV